MPVPPERLVEEILFWKTLQSADVRRPRFVADADGILKVTVPPAAVMVKSVPFVEVAKRTLPVWVCPAGPTAVTPLLIDEVATQVGTPFAHARIWPPVPVPKKVDVAIATTFPDAPVLFTRTVFAAIWASFVSATPLVASVRVPEAPPTRDPNVPEYENSDPSVAEVVATF